MTQKTKHSSSSPETPKLKELIEWRKYKWCPICSVVVTTDLFLPGLKWLPCALLQTAAALGLICSFSDSDPLLHSSMRTLMRSTVLIFYENTPLLCCISLTLDSPNSELPNSIFLSWLFISLSLSLSQGKISLTFFFPAVGICCPTQSLFRGNKENMAKVNLAFPNCTQRDVKKSVKFTHTVQTTSKIWLWRDRAALSRLSSSWVRSSWRADSHSQTSVDSLCFMLSFKLIWAQQSWQVKAEL